MSKKLSSAVLAVLAWSVAVPAAQGAQPGGTAVWTVTFQWKTDNAPTTINNTFNADGTGSETDLDSAGVSTPFTYSVNAANITWTINADDGCVYTGTINGNNMSGTMLDPKSGGTGTWSSTPAITKPAITSFQVTPIGITLGQLVQGTVAATLSNGGGVSFSWNFGDNTAVQAGASVTHTYAALGAYIVTLTATSNAGLTATKMALVTVGVPIKGTTPANPPPNLLGAAITKSNGKATLSISVAKPLTSSFKGVIDAIPFPASMTQTSLTGAIVSLTLASSPIPYTFKLNNKGSGKSGSLMAFALNVKARTVTFTIGKDATLNGLIAALPNWSYTPPAKSKVKLAPFTVAIPTLLDVKGFSLPIVVSFVVACKQSSTTVKGSVAK